ncbi:Deubiquitination-protection protein dph1, putative [Perkinsus marinus ATCC 50983]|uniref:Deubiquitination-protection protein dph1, putative n=1 Tax=Perkinsus marinus (strain ATCC 50983 / TXsc) TaxID=423536 RepID=C5LIA8_PERM5|nr:Deubiquitination-protection protein dph1, putative [Perkinsus marinus ATCC 50983]EER03524.1 Deubiquitination-protection protein dph1, putative [Perkinsus marinus ATCC 50983]|eukprot:XP_002771708.1 Deubiquitination-protection protein dph1, putative [Perkinsus marinus ATCC 50983]
MSINITFKVSGGSSFEQSFDPETTIGDVKKGCVEKSGVPAEQQRLIYKGRILKDADTVGQHKIESGHTIHLVKGAAPAGSSQPTPAAAAPAAPAPTPVEPTPAVTPTPPVAPTAPSNDYMQQAMAQAMAQGAGGGMGAGMNAMMQDPQVMSQMMQSPMVQQAMQSLAENPQLLQQMMATNPMMQQMMAQNPQMAAIMSNPDLLRFLMNPQTMQAMMQLNQAMAGNQQQQQQGAPAPAAPVPTTTTPAQSTAPPNPAPTGPATSGQPDYASMMQAMQNNPLMAQMLAGGGAGAIPAPNHAELEQRYASELETLRSMGFVDTAANLEALRVCDGNVELAVNYLFDMGAGN